MSGAPGGWQKSLLLHHAHKVGMRAELGKSKWGLSKWGLKVLVHNCPRLPLIVAILRRKFPLERGSKRPQKCTIVDDCAQIAESGLKATFESPHWESFLRLSRQKQVRRSLVVFVLFLLVLLSFLFFLFFFLLVLIFMILLLHSLYHP